MPRLTLQRKFFLALTILLAALLLVFVGLSRLGLQRSLGDYVAEIELTRMDWLTLRLEQAYTQHGSWQFLQDDADAWHHLQMPQDGGPRGPGSGRFPRESRLADAGFAPPDHWPPPGAPEYGRGAGPDGRAEPRPQPQIDLLPRRHAPPPPPDDPGDPRAGPDSVYQRLAVLDASGRNIVAGEAIAVDNAIRQPLRHQNQVIGYLALAPLQSMQTEAGRAFITQQLGFVVATGMVGLLLALLISWQLARRWLAPIRGLIQGAQAVASGQLDTQVPLRGTDELATLTQTFNTMAMQLAGTEASRQRWLADVAHELRTPLAALRAEIEALQDGVRPFTNATADRLHRQTMRLGQLVDDLRLTMDGNSGLPALQRVCVQPVDLLIETAGLLQVRFAEAGLALDLDGLQPLTRDTGPVLEADARRLGQVFFNLLENSLKYTNAGGRVVLSASLDRDQLLLDVQDSAPAPEAHDLPRIFDRFYRGEASRNRALGGSGLGLSICKALVEAHGGQVKAQASALGGLWVRLRFPLATP